MGRDQIGNAGFPRSAQESTRLGRLLRGGLGIFLVCCVAPSITVAQDVAVHNLLGDAEYLYSTDGGETFAPQPPVIAPRQSASMQVKLVFERYAHSHFAAEAEDYAALSFSHDASANVSEIGLMLNGQDVSLPLERMNYRIVPGIDPALLKPGDNTLLATFTVRNRSSDSDLVFTPTMTLTPLAGSDLAFQTGPLLGAFGTDFFTVTCRTNVPARISVYGWEGNELRDARIADQLQGVEPVAETELGLLHRLRVPREVSPQAGLFAVVAERDGFRIGTTVHAPEYPTGPFELLVLGDSRTNVEIWHGVTTAAVAAAGDATLMVHVGDLVTLGTRDWEWDTQFWQPGRALLEKLPVYPVIGNHEANAPLYDSLFFGPAADGGARNWAQELGGILLIGIDGGQDWTEESANAAWLEETLSRSEAAFTFLFSHYPAWSSAGHGRLNDEGIPRERPSREARNVVIPMLSRHGATAYIAGHDHMYERSELPGGVTGITCGGGGAPLYEKTEDAARQNPYSEVYSAQHHFCVFDIDSGAVTMRVLSVEGELIDARTWSAKDK